MNASTVLCAIPDKCTGCMACVEACSIYHVGEFDRQRARVRVLMDDAARLYMPVVCVSCPDMPCIASCPVDAIGLGDVLVPVVDMEKCTGCGSCAEACPFGHVWISDRDGLAYKCDLCGGDPQCTRVCTYDALTKGEPSAEATASKIGYLAARLNRVESDSQS